MCTSFITQQGQDYDGKDSPRRTRMRCATEEIFCDGCEANVLSGTATPQLLATSMVSAGKQGGQTKCLREHIVVDAFEAIGQGEGLRDRSRLSRARQENFRRKTLPAGLTTRHRRRTAWGVEQRSRSSFLAPSSPSSSAPQRDAHEMT